jgi:ABC-type polysaccharide/polyol phosphate export permease
MATIQSLAYSVAALAQENNGNLGGILWIIAAVLVIAGIVTLIRGGVLAGILLIVLGLLVGPGGVSIFD